jgi:hypothetical protein
METNTGGSAFQVVSENGLGHISDGMTLRDYFAAKALQNHPHNLHEHELIAQFCYKMADAMINAREVKNG